MRINKSKFTPEELKQYEALIAKAREPDEAPGIVPEENIRKNTPTPEPVPVPEPPSIVPENKPHETTQKSALAPEVAEEIAALKKFRENFELQQAREVAKKYTLLGKNEDELAKTLCRLKKSDEASYTAMVSAMDEHLALVEQTGLFTEIGKSGHGYYGSGGTVTEKIEQAATEIQKAEPSLNRRAAVAKAWEMHPELVHEYENEYWRTRT